MNVLLVIDHLGSGGAQRQIVELACGLKRRGHYVHLFVYFPDHDFFRSRVEEHQIRIHEYSRASRISLGVVSKLASLARRCEIDVVISYLNSANVYAELAKLIWRGCALIVSERTSHHDDKNQKAVLVRRMLHVMADHVVANSVTHCAWLSRKWWLRNKVSCIYNGIDLDEFCPDPIPAKASRQLRLLGIGRIGPEKNILVLVKALALFCDKVGYVPEVSWAGRRDESAAGGEYCQRIDDALSSMPEIRSRWHWLGEQANVIDLLRTHDALVHPSSYEGLPNVICEALATGTPALVSDVCDHPLLVADRERGFLFDQDDPESIAGAMRDLHDLDDDGRRMLSTNAREYAEAELGSEKMVVAYESLMARLAGRAVPGDAMRERS